MDLEPRRVQQLAKNEGMPKEARGQYDLGKCMAWYIRYLHGKMREKAAMEQGGEFRSAGGERSRVLKAEADLKELKLARERRRLVAITDVEKFSTDLVVATKAAVLAVPSRVALSLVGAGAGEIREKLELELKTALTKLSTGTAPAPEVQP